MNINGIEVIDFIFHRIPRLMPITNNELINAKSFFAVLLVLPG